MRVEIQSKNGLKTVNLNRRRAVRERCLNCSAWSTKEVTACKFTDCPLYVYREGRGTQNAKERSKAIRAYCLWCMNGQREEIVKCVSRHCALFLFRRTARDRCEKSKPLQEKAYLGACVEAISLG